MSGARKDYFRLSALRLVDDGRRVSGAIVDLTRDLPPYLAALSVQSDEKARRSLLLLVNTQHNHVPDQYRRSRAAVLDSEFAKISSPYFVSRMITRDHEISVWSRPDGVDPFSIDSRSGRSSGIKLV